MSLWGFKKHRQLDLEARLKERRSDERKIKFDRLPRKGVRPLWWSLFLFVVILFLFLYLQKF